MIIVVVCSDSHIISCWFWVYSNHLQPRWFLCATVYDDFVYLGIRKFFFFFIGCSHVCLCWVLSTQANEHLLKNLWYTVHLTHFSEPLVKLNDKALLINDEKISSCKTFCVGEPWLTAQRCHISSLQSCITHRLQAYSVLMSPVHIYVLHC